ncbi:MAG: glycosyltransferase family 39 protein [Phycisphaerae bacterium]|nr:glycosyltransferase family 39 protein [Phycisphaerae bacterium]
MAARRRRRTEENPPPTPAVPDGTPAGRPGWLRWADLASHVVVPVGFIAIMLAFHPFRTYFELDPDEGNNVIKSLLLDRGYHLYSQIWSDQAPLFSYALQWWFDLFGWTINAARVFMIVCSAVTLWGVYQTARLLAGHVAGIAAVLLLLLTPYYIALSVSIMLGLPALMWAVVSLWALTVWMKRGGNPWLLLSAVALSLSVMTKLFTGFLVPIFGTAVLIKAWWDGRGSVKPARRLIPPAAWSVAWLVLTGLMLLVIVRPSGLTQLIRPHVEAQDVWAEASKTTNVNTWLAGARPAGGAQDIVVLGGVGLALACLRRRWEALAPAAWAVVAYLLLSSHAPVWYHHVTLVTIPVALLAGVGVGAIVPTSVRGWSMPRSARAMATLFVRLTGVVCVAFVLVHVHDKYLVSKQLGGMVEYAPRDRYLTAVMKQYAEHSKWVFSDRQIYAFAAGLPVPPELSVTSRKRLFTTKMSNEDIVNILRKYSPDQVVMGGWRMLMTTPMLEFLRERYTLIYSDELNPGGADGLYGVYIRHGMEGDAPAALKAALIDAPDCVQAYDNLARQEAAHGRTDAAIEYYREALKRSPSYGRARLHLAETLLALGRYEEGFREFAEGLRQTDERGRVDPELVIRAAWRWATCPEPRFRNGERAEGLAHLILKQSGETAANLDRLAAAYAAQGRFQDAVQTAALAVRRAEEQKQVGQARVCQRRLERYQANHAWQESIRVPQFP